MSAGAIYVGRPTIWGNPYTVRNRTHKRAVELYEEVVIGQLKREGKLEEFLKPLRGHDLSCFCPLEQPCHADVLLRLANKE